MDNEQTTTDRRLQIPTREVATWVYVIALAVVAGAGWAFFTHGTQAHAEPQLPWWAVALGFACAEICVVHVRFRRSAHSFSLADLPFVFGLVFASGDAFVLGALVGTGIVWGLVRRLPVVKVVFNLAQIALTATSAAIILHVIAGDAAMDHPQTWVGLYTASLSSGALTILLLSAAIQISEGTLKRPMMAQMFATDALVTLINASIAIAAALVVANDARAVPVLLIPALTVFAVYRAYISERQRHERLEFLYDANRTLSRSPEVAEALEALLARSLEAFNADVAETLLFTADGDALRTTHGPGDHRVTMEPADRAIADELAGLVDAENPVVSLTPPFGSPHLRAHMQARGIRHAMIAMLPGEERTIGTIMLANRVGLERSFGADDLRLLEALANNAAVALQYDRLEQAVNKLEALQDQLHHQAYHDPLTDLPNRTLFMERVRQELADDGEAAVLFVDVDDFKTINDSLGHAVGDALLVSVAERMRECVRPEDTIARLGGDEFAVMIPGVGDPLVDGRAVARRILKAFELPGRGRHRARVSPSLRRPRLQPPVRRRRRRADPQRRRRHVPGEVQGQGALRALRAADGRRDPPSPRHEGRAGEGDRAPADDRPVPADRRAGQREDRRRRGARALGAPGARPRAARRVRAARRGDRADRAARALRPQRGLPAGPPLAGRRSGRDRAAAHAREPVGRRAARSRTSSRTCSLAINTAGIDPAQLVIELTESQLLVAAGVERFHELRALGVKIALDDFGTGYSSLSYLHSLPLDTLKIAKPFIDGLTSGRRESSFVGMIVDLARTLELEVIAEGIETHEQLAALREMNAGLGQGYFLGRPSAAAPRLARSTR